MRQTAARTNRAWLVVLGVLLVLGGAAMLVTSTGQLLPLAADAGLALRSPSPADHLVGAATSAALATTWVVLVVAVVAVVVGLLGLAWLVAQVPRNNPAKPFRLHDDARTGLTRCEPAVLTAAVVTQVEALASVQGAAAVLRGTAAEPDLTIKLTASDRADLPRLLADLQDRVAADLADALDTRLARLGVQVEVETVRTRTDQIVV